LKRCLEPHRQDGAGCPVAVLYQTGDAARSGARGASSWAPTGSVKPSDDLLARLRSEFGASG
jgi:hypothetical protein